MKISNTDRIILGIDPGTAVTGYGLIQLLDNKLSLLSVGVMELGDLDWDQPMKLKRILERVLGLIEEFHPDELAIEAPFYGRNVQVMLKLGRAQGVVIAAAVMKGIAVVEYAPKKVKKALTGNGNASKEQVARMVERMLPELLKQATPLKLDATDALAVALCHYLQQNPFNQALTKENKKVKVNKSNSWKSFVSANPNRVK